MKKQKLSLLSILATILFLVGGCSSHDNNTTESKSDTSVASTSETPSQPSLDNLDFLKEMNGKYIFEVNLFEHPKLKDRFKKLLGSDLKLIMQWDVASPIEVKNDMFSAGACMPHNCDVSNYIIVADIKNNLLYAGVRNEGKVTTYTENKGELPAQIKEWEKQ